MSTLHLPHCPHCYCRRREEDHIRTRAHKQELCNLHYHCQDAAQVQMALIALCVVCRAVLLDLSQGLGIGLESQSILYLQSHGQSQGQKSILGRFA